MNLFQLLTLLWILFGPQKKPDLQRIQHLGLLAVKISQMYALRSDFLPLEKCQHLKKLYRKNTPIPAENFFQLFDEYASQELKNNIEHIEPQSLASASVGQVHKAILRNGKTVVLKIRKKDFKPAFLKDIRNTKRFLRFILFFYPKLKKLADPIGTLETIERLTLTELNLTNEISGTKTLATIRDQYKDTLPYLQNLSFPHIYSEYSNEYVLVSDFINGKSLDELLESKQLDYEKLLLLFRIHGFYIFLQGQFHGDLHPGNIFIEKDSIVFIDNSNIETVPHVFAHGLLDLLKHLSQKEYDLMASTLHNLSHTKLNDIQFQIFQNKIIDLYKNFQNTTVEEESLTQKMMETVKLSIHSGMTFEEGLFGIIKSLMYLDGMVMQCNPKAILMNDVRPFMKDFDALKTQ